VEYSDRSLNDERLVEEDRTLTKRRDTEDDEDDPNGWLIRSSGSSSSSSSSSSSLPSQLLSLNDCSSSPFIPNVKCNFDKLNFVNLDDKKEDLKKLRFENGDTIPDVKSYFI
jgi:hypothetical protein